MGALKGLRAASAGLGRRCRPDRGSVERQEERSGERGRWRRGRRVEGEYGGAFVGDPADRESVDGVDEACAVGWVEVGEHGGVEYYDGGIGRCLGDHPAIWSRPSLVISAPMWR